MLLTPLPLKIIVDNVVGSRPVPGWLGRFVPGSFTDSAGTLLVVAVVLLVFIALVANLQALVSSLLRAWVGERLVLNFRGDLFRHAQRLSLSYHDTAGTADATYRIQKDAASLQDLLIDGALPLVTAVLTLCLMLVVTLWLDWELGLVALTVVPVLLFVSGRYKRRLRQQSREVKKLESDALAVVQEVLTVLRVVKAFGQEDREQDRFLRHSREGMRARCAWCWPRAATAW